MRRCGRSSGARFLRLFALARLLDRYDAEQDSSEVCLPLNHAARVLCRTREDLEADLSHLAGGLGCINWFTIGSRGVAVAVVHAGDRPLYVGDDLFDRAFRVLLRLNLVGDAPRGAVGRICNPSEEVAA